MPASRKKRSTTTRHAKPVARSTTKRATAKVKAKSSPTMASTVEAKPTVTARMTVAEAAYFLWLERGGDAISNWIEAERRVAALATA